MIDLHVGDCLEIMAAMEPESMDSIVTDPPYGLAFMGKDWDHGVPGVHFWAEALRVAKPGAHLLAFGGTRTFHRLAVAIEDAGWEIRDTVMWVYGSGFPKSHDVSKAIDKAAGAEREVVGRRNPHLDGGKRTRYTAGTGVDYGTYAAVTMQDGTVPITAPATHDAERWAGWGTALKPAWEPVIVARKPLVGTVAANVLEWGTGAINVDGCRVDGEPWTKRDGANGSGFAKGKFLGDARGENSRPFSERGSTSGRWPANLVHDGSDEVLAGFPQSNGGAFPGHRNTSGYGGSLDQGATPHGFYKMGDTGSAARFFYCAKASRADRDEGLEGLPQWSPGERTNRKNGSDGLNSPRAGAGRTASAGNHHPTVKPTDLMRWLCRLVTQPDGIVLDPFMGSGSTGKGAVMEGFSFVGIDMDAEYVEIARRRIDAARLPLFMEVD